MKIGDVIVYTGETNSCYTKNKKYIIFRINISDPLSDDNKYGSTVKCWIRDDSDIPTWFHDYEATDPRSEWYLLKDLRKQKIQLIEFLEG